MGPRAPTQGELFEEHVDELFSLERDEETEENEEDGDKSTE